MQLRVVGQGELRGQPRRSVVDARFLAGCRDTLPCIAGVVEGLESWQFYIYRFRQRRAVQKLGRLLCGLYESQSGLVDDFLVDSLEVLQLVAACGQRLVAQVQGARPTDQTPTVLVAPQLPADAGLVELLGNLGVVLRRASDSRSASHGREPLVGVALILAIQVDLGLQLSGNA